MVNLDKTEVIPACPSSQSFAPGDFHCCTWIGSSNFKLLGAPLGSTEWCEDLLGRRLRKARALLAATGKSPDAQGAFCLLHSCSGGLRSSDRAALSLLTLNRGVSTLLTMMFARPSDQREGWELGVLPSTPRFRLP